MNKKGMSSILIFFLVIIVVCGLVFGLTYGSLGMKKFFGPKFKEVDRDIWEETPSRVHGAIQEIATRRLEYIKAEDDIEKTAICSILRDGYSELNPKNIDNYELRRFFESCIMGENYE